MKQPMQIMPDGTAFKVVSGGDAGRRDRAAGELGRAFLAGGPRAMEESRAAFAPCSTVVCGGELGVAGGFAQYAEE